MKRRLDYTAYHEAGHAIAYLLMDKKFKVATIKPEGNALGYVSHKRGNSYNFEFSSMLYPEKFNNHFTEDFINIAGFVAERIYSGRNNKIGADKDFRDWVDKTLLDLPKKLSQKYQRFLLEYATEVFELRINWIRITAIAEALLERKTLTYVQVWEVIKDKLAKDLSAKLP